MSILRVLGLLALAMLIVALPTKAQAATPPACYQKWQTTEDSDPWARLEADCIAETLDYYALQYPKQVEVIDYGVSSAGRRLVAARVTLGISDYLSWKRPSSLIVGSVHGNERMTTRIVMEWLDNLLKEPNETSWVASDGQQGPTNYQLIANNQVFVVPIAQMDEYAARSRRTTSDLDPNRNWGFLWSSDDPVTNGALPHSDPGVRALAGLFKIAQPAVFVSVHGQHTAVDPITHHSCDLGYSQWREGRFFNWRVSVPRNAYWPSGNGSSMRGRSLLDIVSPTKPASLPRLSEAHAAHDDFPRLYSPFDPAKVCVHPNDELARSVGGGQTRGWAWAHEGAVGILHETLHKRFVVGGTSTNRSLDYWDVSRPEAEVRDGILRDMWMPLSRAVDLAGNPTPNATAESSRHADVAVTFLRGFGSGTGDDLMTRLSHFTPPYGHIRLGPSGQTPLTCGITVWGNQQTHATGKIQVENVVTGSIAEHDWQFSRLLPGRLYTTSMEAQFTPGGWYRVSCSVTNAGETDTDQEIVVSDDAGCLVLNDRGEHCENFDAVFTTNNERVITFIAEP